MVYAGCSDDLADVDEMLKLHFVRCLVWSTLCLEMTKAMLIFI